MCKRQKTDKGRMGQSSQRQKIKHAYRSIIGPAPINTGSFFDIDNESNPLFWNKDELVPHDFPLCDRINMMINFKTVFGLFNKRSGQKQKPLFGDFTDHSFSVQIIVFQDNNAHTSQYFSKCMIDIVDKLRITRKQLKFHIKHQQGGMICVQYQRANVQ